MRSNLVMLAACLGLAAGTAIYAAAPDPNAVEYNRLLANTCTQMQDRGSRTPCPETSDASFDDRWLLIAAAFGVAASMILGLAFWPKR